MKNFKENDKVVFSTEHLSKVGFDIVEFAKMLGFIYPKEKEICVIAGGTGSGRYFLKGYLKSKNNRFQAFSDQCLFPVDQVFSDLTESICNQIEKGEELVNQNKK